MENASKALLMAGGFLIALIVASSLAFMWTKISGAHASQSGNVKTEQLAEFNAAFDSYANETVRGTDILSLFNRVNSYDKNLESDVLLANIQYNHIKIKVDITNSRNSTEFKRVLKLNDANENDIAKDNPADDDDTYSILKNFIDWETKVGKDNMTKLSTYAGSSDAAHPFNTLTYEKKADGTTDDINKPIKNIVWQVKQENPGYNPTKLREEVISKLLGKTLTNTNIPDDSLIKDYSVYTEFKTTKFECTEIQYSPDNGQVSIMNFVAKNN